MITEVADFGAVMVPLADVVPHPANFRHLMVDLDELAASITSSGLDEPLVVMPAGRVACAWPEHAADLAGGSWVLLWGHRRLAAARQAYAGDPKAQAPVVIRNDEVCDSRQMQLELMTRQELAHRSWTPIEEARALQALVDAGRTQVEIAEMCGCHQSHVSGRLALLRLPEDIAAAVETGTLRVADARRLARLDSHEMHAVWRLYLNRREDAWITSIDQAIAVYADRAAYQARREASLGQAQAERLRVVDPVEEFGQNVHAHRLKSLEQVQAARYAGNLVAGVSGEGDLTYYTTSPAVDPPPAALSSDQRRAAAAVRERAARLLAASPPPVPIEAAGIVNALLDVAPQGWRPIAQRWLRRLQVGPSGEPDPDRWWEQVRTADWSTRVWAAHSLSLAACEHGARTHDVWDKKDVAWVLRLVTEGGYVPRRWERHRLDGGEDSSSEEQTPADPSPAEVGWCGPHQQCPAEVQLSEATVEWLELDPRRFHEVEKGRKCDLEHGHSGQHSAHVQDAHAEHYQLEQRTGLLHLWAWWSVEPDDYRITPAAGCPAIRPHKNAPSDAFEEVNECLLFAGHGGRHT